MEPRQFGLLMAALVLVMIAVRRTTPSAGGIEGKAGREPVVKSDSEPSSEHTREHEPARASTSAAEATAWASEVHAAVFDASKDSKCRGGCGWTLEYSCPGQPRGSKGPAGDDGSEGYRCCCGAVQPGRAVLADPPSMTAPSPDAPELAAHPPTPPPPPPLEETDAKRWNGRSPNPYIDKYITPAVRDYWATLKNQRQANKEKITALYGGGYCPKERPYVTATDCWRKEVDPMKHGTREGQPAGADWDKKWAKMATCECDGSHRKDNQTNWDINRRAFCTALNAEAETKFPVPSELKHVLDLNFGDPLTPDGMLPQKFAAPFPSGPAAGELKWDPATVKAHFLKLRAALTFYYQGEQNLDAKLKSRPGDEAYAELIHALSQKFAAGLVHGGGFVIGTMGDSTVAGQDNCAFDAWPYGVERQLTPLLLAAGVNLTVRNVGHNGGWATNPQLTCSGNLVGNDADLVIYSGPYVKPSGQTWAHLQFVRRTLLAGAIPLVASGDKLREKGWAEEMKKYVKLGVAMGDGLTGEVIERWYPDNTGDHNPFWGRAGDGLCHTFKTRSGSASVMNRNWHPGPMGHQIFQDRLSFFYADAIVKAIEHIEKAVKADGGKLGPLQKRWPRRVAVLPSQLPDKAEWCKQTVPKDNEIAKQAAKATYCGTMDERGYAQCATGLLPTHGTLLQDWHVEGGPDWGEPSGAGGKAWTIERRGANERSWPGGWTGGDGGPFSYTTCGNNCYGAQSRAHTWEANRSTEACIGQDYDDSYEVMETKDDRPPKMGAWLTFRIPGGTMHVGHISICGFCKDPDNDNRSIAPTVKLKGELLKDGVLPGVEWGFDDWGSGDVDTEKFRSCATVIKTLPAPTLAKDVLLGIHCRSGRLQYIITV